MGKGKKLKTRMWLMCLLYRNEYSNLEQTRATMGKGIDRSEEE
jgi:hypothetical protein